MYFIYSRVILDQFTKRYEEIITIRPTPHTNTNNYLSSIQNYNMFRKGHTLNHLKIHKIDVYIHLMIPNNKNDGVQ